MLKTDSNLGFQSSLIFSIDRLATLEDLRLLDIPKSNFDGRHVSTSCTPSEWFSTIKPVFSYLSFSIYELRRALVNPYHCLIEILQPIVIYSLVGDQKEIAFPHQLLTNKNSFLSYGVKSLAASLDLRILPYNPIEECQTFCKEIGYPIQTAYTMKFISDSFCYYRSSSFYNISHIDALSPPRIYNFRLLAKRRSLIGSRLHDIIQLLHSYGFVNAEDLGGNNNPAIYRNVTSFVGIHGAFLPNLLGAECLSDVAEIFPSSYVVPSNLCVLAQKSLFFNAIYGDTIFNNNQPTHDKELQSPYRRSDSEPSYVNASVIANDYLYMRILRHLILINNSAYCAM